MGPSIMHGLCPRVAPVAAGPANRSSLKTPSLGVGTVLGTRGGPQGDLRGT